MKLPLRGKNTRRAARVLLGKRGPRHRGVIHVQGPGRAIRVGRDRFGVPYVKAESEDDAWFGLGFCHAQDRAGQLEMLLRAIRGTLAEVLGEEGLAIDRLSRRIGFRRAAAAQWALCAPDVHAQVTAYVQGVNEGLRRGSRRRPHELLLLGREPTPWEPEDVQGYLVVLAFGLASNWDMELLRYAVLANDGVDALRLMEPTYPAGFLVTNPPGAAAGNLAARTLEELGSVGRVVHPGGGSNAWALSGRRTRSGRPLLANDPHLGATVPNTLYLASLEAPGMHVVGATLPGIPAFCAGHNGHAAWGITAAHADNTDLFVEKLGPDGRSVIEDGRVVPCEVREESIVVKGRPQPVVERVLVTRRGPIVSEAMPELPAGALSLSATWLMARPQRGLFGAHRARSFQTFRELFREASASSVSMVYADVDDHVGWVLGVELPRRRRGLGLVPQPGWTAGAGWEPDLVPNDELPAVVDPPAGFVATANNQPEAADGGPHFLGADWLDGYRLRRIVEALEVRDDWDVASTAELQKDTLSIPWRELKDVVLAGEPRSADGAMARRLLEVWDGRVASDSSAASIFELFVADLQHRVTTAIAPRTAPWLLGKGLTPLLPHSTVLARRLRHLVVQCRQQPPEVFDDWPAQIEAALAGTIGRLRRRFGPDPSEWRWGRVRPLELMHLFGRKPPLDRLFNLGPYPGEGDSSTLSQGQVDLQDPTSRQLSAPVLRMVVDVGNWEACRFAILGGQSGNPVSRHYGDQMAVWRTGAGIPIAWSPEAVARRIRTRLELAPT